MCRQHHQRRWLESAEGAAGLPHWPGAEPLVLATKRTEVSDTSISPSFSVYYKLENVARRVRVDTLVALVSVL